MYFSTSFASLAVDAPALVANVHSIDAHKQICYICRQMRPQAVATLLLQVMVNYDRMGDDEQKQMREALQDLRRGLGFITSATDRLIALTAKSNKALPN
jgi:hypothetical protein